MTTTPIRDDLRAFRRNEAVLAHNKPEWCPATLGRDSHLVFATEPSGFAADQYRKAAKRLDVPMSKRLLVVTSPGPEDGKSTTSSNIAWALSERGHSVLLLELDLRRPTFHKIFPELPATKSVVDVLQQTARPDQMISRVKGTTLDVAAVRGAQPNVARIMQSTALVDTLRWAQSHYDWVILDTPPVLAVADTPELASHAEQVLLVVRARKTRAALLKPAIELLGASLKYVLFNDGEPLVSSYYYGYVTPPARLRK